MYLFGSMFHCLFCHCFSHLDTIKDYVMLCYVIHTHRQTQLAFQSKIVLARRPLDSKAHLSSVLLSGALHTTPNLISNRTRPSKGTTTPHPVEFTLIYAVRHARRSGTTAQG